MKSSGSMGGLAGAMALSCLLGLSPQQAGAAVVLDGCSGGSFGNACSLAELVGGGSMLINDTRFSKFGLDSFAGRALNAAVIRVDPIDLLLNPGFTLVDTDGTLTLANGELTFNNFFFDVTVISPYLAIKDNSLAMAVGNLTGDNSFTHISEQVFDSTLTTVLGLKDAFCDATITPGCANSTVTDSALFSPTVTELSVQAGIDVVADAAGVAGINSITMQFAQVPEPASLALLTLGLAGIGVSSRRRRQQGALNNVFTRGLYGQR